MLIQNSVSAQSKLKFISVFLTFTNRMSIQTLIQAVIILNSSFPLSTTSIHVFIPSATHSNISQLYSLLLPSQLVLLGLRASPFLALIIILSPNLTP